MKLRFLVFAFAVVLASGCPQPGGVADGVRINSFGFDSSTIGDKEEVELSLEVENVGAYDAERVRFFVYGYDSVWGVVDSEGEISFPEDFSWGAGGLRGYNMEAKTPGLSKNFYSIFRVADDSISKGITKKYTFNGRLCYYYETKATGTIKTISASQKRDEARGGGFSQSGVSMKNSYAPVQVEVKTKSPLVFYGSGDMMSAELALIIRNVAGGYTASGRCSQDVDVTEINKIAELEVYLDGEALDCTYEDLSFYDGELVVYCDYSVESSQPKGEYLLSVVAGYYYYVDRSATISVVGSSDETVVGGTRPGSVADVVLLDNYCLLYYDRKINYCEFDLRPIKWCGTVREDCIVSVDDDPLISSVGLINPDCRSGSCTSEKDILNKKKIEDEDINEIGKKCTELKGELTEEKDLLLCDSKTCYYKEDILKQCFTPNCALFIELLREKKTKEKLGGNFPASCNELLDLVRDKDDVVGLYLGSYSNGDKPCYAHIGGQKLTISRIDNKAVLSQINKYTITAEYEYADSEQKKSTEEVFLVPIVVFVEGEEPPVSGKTPQEIEGIIFFDDMYLEISSGGGETLKYDSLCGSTENVVGYGTGYREFGNGDGDDLNGTIWYKEEYGSYKVEYYLHTIGSRGKVIDTKSGVVAKGMPEELKGIVYMDYYIGVRILDAAEKFFEAEVLVPSGGFGTGAIDIGEVKRTCGYVLMYEKEDGRYLLRVAKMGEIDEEEEE